MTKQTLPATQYQQYHEMYPELFLEPLDEPFEPSETQLEREAALKRFNRLYVLAPIITISVISILTIIAMVVAVLVMSISDNVNNELISFISGLADITIIMFAFPLIILMISGPVMLGAMINRSWTRRKMGKPAFDQGGSLQVLFWKIDKGIQNAHVKTNETAPQMADQVIRLNESIAYVQGFTKQMINNFKRS